MIAIEIRLNGELKAVCGAEDATEVLAIIRAAGQLGADADSSEPPSFAAECMGVRNKSKETSDVMKWVSTTIKQGDELSIRFVEVKRASAPIDTQEIAKHPDS